MRISSKLFKHKCFLVCFGGSKISLRENEGDRPLCQSFYQGRGLKNVGKEEASSQNSGKWLSSRQKRECEEDAGPEKAPISFKWKCLKKKIPSLWRKGNTPIQLVGM